MTQAGKTPGQDAANAEPEKAPDGAGKTRKWTTIIDNVATDAAAPDPAAPGPAAPAANYEAADMERAPPKPSPAGQPMGDKDVPAEPEPDIYHHEADNEPVHGRHETGALAEGQAQAYWRENVRLLSALLVVWFAVSFGFGIVLAEPLNRLSVFGFKLGFWWAQQGSIFVFVALIFVYVVWMKRIERRYGVDDDDPAIGQGAAGS